VSSPVHSRNVAAVIASAEPPYLHGVPPSAGDPLEGEGLALAYAALERVRADHGLQRLTVAVDDPGLGRQLLGVPRSDLPDRLELDADWRTEPPVGAATDIELAVTVCRLALRACSLHEGTLAPPDALELALRALDGVEGVAIDAEHDTVRIQLPPGAPTDNVAHDALELVKARLDRTVVVEVVGTAGVAAPRSDLTPISWSPPPSLQLIALREDPETGELEVHLGGGEVRTVGRAARARGLAGVAEATLAAWRDRPGVPPRAIAWARTVETSDDHCVVAVALENPRRVIVARGIGAGSNPLEAAAHATIDALSR
jgi:hypothetical protein